MGWRRTLKLSAKQRTDLEHARDHHDKFDVRERAAAILKIAAGRSPHWVAKHGLLKPRAPDTVYTWLDWYEEEGLEGIEKHRQGAARWENSQPFRSGSGRRP